MTYTRVPAAAIAASWLGEVFTPPTPLSIDDSVISADLIRVASEKVRTRPVRPSSLASRPATGAP